MEKGRIVRGSAGSFLDPPGYPTHSFEVETDLRRRPQNRGTMSLTYAAEQATWLDDATRNAARRLLAEWASKRPSLDDPDIQDWIHQVLGYFRDQYAGLRAEQTGSKWDVSNLRSDAKVDPVLNADLHAGVHLIRQYYPEFKPTQRDFAQAYWGTKASAHSANMRRAGAGRR